MEAAQITATLILMGHPRMKMMNLLVATFNPEGIPQYNWGMHGVDIWDQLRKYFGIDLDHRTGKWTLRIFEILWSMICTNGYNIYRYNNANNALRKLSDAKFKLAIIRGLLKHPIVNAPVHQTTGQTAHTIAAFPVPIRRPNARESARRFVSECRQCPASNEDGSR